MPQKAAFHQGLHCLPRQKHSLEGGGGGLGKKPTSIWKYQPELPQNELFYIKQDGRVHLTVKIGLNRLSDVMAFVLS